MPHPMLALKDLLTVTAVSEINPNRLRQWQDAARELLSQSAEAPPERKEPKPPRPK